MWPFLNNAYKDVFIIIIAYWPVILLFVFNAVCYGKFFDFVGFLSMVIQVKLFYIHNI